MVAQAEATLRRAPGGVALLTAGPILWEVAQMEAALAVAPRNYTKLAELLTPGAIAASPGRAWTGAS